MTPPGSGGGSQLLVRPAIDGDARRIAEIHVRTWQVAYSGIVPADYLASLSVDRHEAMWRERIAKQSPLLVAVESGRVRGWVAFGPSRDEGAASDMAEIWAIYVDESCWGRGVGRALWRHLRTTLADQGFRHVGVWAFTGNQRADRFYRSLGFGVDAGSARQFTLGGATLSEVRYVGDIGA